MQLIVRALIAYGFKIPVNFGLHLLLKKSFFIRHINIIKFVKFYEKYIFSRPGTLNEIERTIE